MVGKSRGEAIELNDCLDAGADGRMRAKSGLTCRSLGLHWGYMETEHNGRRGDWEANLVLDILTMVEISSWKLYI